MISILIYLVSSRLFNCVENSIKLCDYACVVKANERHNIDCALILLGLTHFVKYEIRFGNIRMKKIQKKFELFWIKLK